MSSLFSPPSMPPIQPPPPAPQPSDPAIANRAAAEAALRQQGGRASQFMTDPTTQTKPEKSKQRYLSGTLA